MSKFDELYLLVPASTTRHRDARAARLRGHEKRAARIVAGLEGALVDAEILKLDSLEPDDIRTFDLRVAGPAALLIAKVHKIEDRQSSSRLNDKDALDVARLLRGTETDVMRGARFRFAAEDELIAGHFLARGETYRHPCHAIDADHRNRAVVREPRQRQRRRYSDADSPVQRRNARVNEDASP